MSTKERILDTAERLFGEQGYDATSLRHIIGEAELTWLPSTTTSAPKTISWTSLIARKAGPVNQNASPCSITRRPQGSRTALHRGDSRRFHGPHGRSRRADPQFVRVMGRIHAEGLMASVVASALSDHRCPLQRGAAARPSRPAEAEFVWRVHFMVGAMAAYHVRRSPFSGHPRGPRELNQRIDRLIAFVSAGFVRPSRSSRNSRSNHENIYPAAAIWLFVPCPRPARAAAARSS